MNKPVKKTQDPLIAFSCFLNKTDVRYRHKVCVKVPITQFRQEQTRFTVHLEPMSMVQVVEININPVSKINKPKFSQVGTYIEKDKTLVVVETLIATIPQYIHLTVTLDSTESHMTEKLTDSVPTDLFFKNLFVTYGAFETTPKWLSGWAFYLSTCNLTYRKNKDTGCFEFIHVPYINLLEKIENQMKVCEGTTKLVNLLISCYYQTVKEYLNCDTYSDLVYKMANKRISEKDCNIYLCLILLTQETKSNLTFSDTFIINLHSYKEELESYGIALLKI